MMEKCGHNDQFGICPLERGHTGEHAKVPHRTYSAEELAQAEARGVQSGLEMAAAVTDKFAAMTRGTRMTVAATAKRQLSDAIRTLQPIPQAPQAEVKE